MNTERIVQERVITAPLIIWEITNAMHVGQVPNADSVILMDSVATIKQDVIVHFPDHLPHAIAFPYLAEYTLVYY